MKLRDCKKGDVVYVEKLMHMVVFDSVHYDKRYMQVFMPNGKISALNGSLNVVLALNKKLIDDYRTNYNYYNYYKKED